MKHFVILLLFFSTSTLFAQDLKLIEKDLTRSFHEIGFWHNKIYSSNYDPTFENSLEDANDSFELLLLKYTSSNLQTLNYDFKGLLNNGLTITTSEDGLFRIYSWDTQTGGTMLNINNVFQFRIGKNIYSQILTNNHSGQPFIQW